MKKISIKYLFAIGALLSLHACDGFLTETNPNQPNQNGYFQGPEQATQVVNAVYATLQRHDLYKRQYNTIRYLGGDVAPTAGAGGWGDLFIFDIDANTADFVGSSWGDLYLGVARSNSAIEIVSNLSEEVIRPELKVRLVGEATFLRGLFNFHIVTLYGEAPLIDRAITSVDDPDFKPSNNTRAELWASIEADFRAAVVALPKKEAYSGADVGRASKGAAQGFLGKALLYQEKWAESATEFGKLVNEPATYGDYDLTADYSDNFTAANENNVESLFEVQFLSGKGAEWNGDDNGVDTEGGMLGTHFSPYVFANGYPSVDINKFFDDNLTGTDVRRLYTIAREGDMWGDREVKVKNPDPSNPANVGPYFDGRIPNAFEVVNNDTIYGYSGIRKYIGLNDPYLNSDINIILMRYADVLLMYAEALNESGQSAIAYQHINKVRQRAGAEPLVAGADSALLRRKIKDERRLELSLEGFRWLDVVRWGDAGVEFKDRGFVVGKHETIPIPAGELLVNENLSQTAGWK